MDKVKDNIDTSKIDELYETYCYDSDMFAYQSFLNALHSKPENGGGNVLIENLQKYIEKYSKKIPSMYESLKKDEQENEVLENVVYTIQNISTAVNYLLDYYDKIDDEKTGMKYSHRHIRPNDMFCFNSYTIKDAFEKYHKELNISRKAFNKTFDLLEFFKKKKSLQKVFGENDWYNMDTKEILLSLKDYHKLNLSGIEIGSGDDSYIKELIRVYSYGFFEKVKHNCDAEFETFDQYRPSFISKQAISPDIDKLIFCKNLLEFYEKDLYVDRNGYLDCKVGYDMPEYLIAKFRKVYNSKFNEKTFRENQANVIFNPDFNYTHSIEYIKPNAIVGVKNIQTDEKLVIGLILENYTGEIYHLMHIAINDISKEKSSYEIQLNLLPQGHIDKRIQLLRVDNYETQQAHKNLGGKKLPTSTHVHLYNHFDLLRGKVNGNYDISHNLENDSTDFISALHGFLSVMDLDVELHNEIVKKIKEIKRRRVRKELKDEKEI